MAVISGGWNYILLWQLLLEWDLFCDNFTIVLWKQKITKMESILRGVVLSNHPGSLKEKLLKKVSFLGSENIPMITK